MNKIFPTLGMAVLLGMGSVANADIAAGVAAGGATDTVKCELVKFFPLPKDAAGLVNSHSSLNAKTANFDISATVTGGSFDPDKNPYVDPYSVLVNGVIMTTAAVANKCDATATATAANAAQ